MTRPGEPAPAPIDIGGHLFPPVWLDLLPEDFPWLAPPRESLAIWLRRGVLVERAA